MEQEKVNPDERTWEQFVIRMLADGHIKSITIRVKSVVNSAYEKAIDEITIMPIGS